MFLIIQTIDSHLNRLRNSKTHFTTFSINNVSASFYAKPKLIQLIKIKCFRIKNLTLHVTLDINIMKFLRKERTCKISNFSKQLWFIYLSNNLKHTY